MAPWPTDPSKLLDMQEKMWAVVDDLLRKGEKEQFGVFPDGTSGFSIVKGEAVDLYRDVSMFLPYCIFETHEIIPYEKSKEVTRAILKAQIAAMKK
jgi:hypothetical protein